VEPAVTDRDTTSVAPVTIRLEPGGDACVLGLDRDRVDLEASSPSAPGTRLRGRLDDGRELRLKVLRCLRRGNEFAIEARLIDASRELRRAVAALLASAQQSNNRQDAEAAEE
jgi:hypothetical protein